MKIVFISNYFNHHQKPLSDGLAARVDYTFIATAEMTEERRALGWGGECEPEYVLRCHDDLRQAEACLVGADAVIAGSAPEELVRKCIRRGQTVLRYSERPLKDGPQWGKYLPRLVKWHWRNPPGRPIWLLCAGAYTAGDYARFGLFRRRALRWGYFPETGRGNEVLPEGKEKASLLWAGRFLDWKHPDDALAVARRLRAEHIDFTLQMIGSGPLEAALRRTIADEGLQDCVLLTGAMEPGAVRREMERAEIFLFTSGRQEGWGAVLNEAMSSGCAVVAGHAAGATPYLVHHGKNGLIYPSGEADSLYEQVKRLLQDDALRRRLGAAARRTIADTWNGDEAAGRLVAVIEALRAGEEPTGLYADGPCSAAEKLGEDWYHR